MNPLDKQSRRRRRAINRKAAQIMERTGVNKYEAIRRATRQHKREMRRDVDNPDVEDLLEGLSEKERERAESIMEE